MSLSMRYSNSVGGEALLYPARGRIKAFLNLMLHVVAYACYFTPEPYAVSRTVLIVWRFVIALVSAVSLYRFARNTKITLHWVLFTASVLSYYILSSILKQSDTNWLLVCFYCVSIIGYITLLECDFSNNYQDSLRAFIIAGVIMCGVHYVTFLLYRNVPFGMRYAEMIRVKTRYEEGIWFFLKHDNGSVFYFIPVMTALWYYVCEYSGFRRTAVIFSLLTLYMYWSQWSVAAMIAFTLLVCLCVLIYLGYIKRTLPTYNLSLIIGIFACLSIIRFVTNPGDYTYAFSRIVNRSVTFSGRGLIWPRAINEIRKSLIIGLGCESDTMTILRIGTNHTHNLILQLAYTGGLLSLFLYVMALFSCNRRDMHGSAKGQLCLRVSALLVLLVSSVDWYFYLPVQFTVFVMYYYSYITAA